MDYVSVSLLFWSTVVTAVKSFKFEIHPANFSTVTYFATLQFCMKKESIYALSFSSTEDI